MRVEVKCTCGRVLTQWKGRGAEITFNIQPCPACLDGSYDKGYRCGRTEGFRYGHELGRRDGRAEGYREGFRDACLCLGEVADMRKRRYG